MRDARIADQRYILLSVDVQEVGWFNRRQSS